jgi:N-acetylneuraminate synthase
VSARIIAEAGSNHCGRLDLALALVDAAADAGADAVKFQLFRAARLYPREAGRAGYLGDPADIAEIVAALELPEAWLGPLAGRARERGLDLLVTPFDERSADLVDPFVDAFKMASYELTHHPLLRHVAGKGKPVILSTGAATIEEAADALAVLRAAGAPRVTLLQCTAAYPARLETLEVGAMAELRDRLGVPVGLSDHSLDPVIAPVAAVALGASVIEKHFTLDRGLEGPDHRFALEPGDLARMVSAVRDAERAVGTGRKRVHEDERELRDFARRTVFALREVEAGDVLRAEDLAVLRRGRHPMGLPPTALAELPGRRARRRLAAHRPVLAADVD